MYMSDKFDIVIPVGPCDINQFKQQLEYTRRNVIGYRRIYLVCFDPSLLGFINDPAVVVVSDDIFPFTKNDVAHIHGNFERNAWYLQQLLKLYAGLVLPDILDRYLVIDCDTYFLRQTLFVSETSGKSLYNTGTENHEPYFEHMGRLHVSLTRQFPQYSGICHHMMFETRFVRELFEMVEKEKEKEKEKNQPFWRIFLQNVRSDYFGMDIYNASGASEYEIYFNFIMKYHPNDVEIRQLRWANVSVNPMNINNKNTSISYVSWHYYMRREKYKGLIY